MTHIELSKIVERYMSERFVYSFGVLKGIQGEMGKTAKSVKNGHFWVKHFLVPQTKTSTS